MPYRGKNNPQKYVKSYLLRHMRKDAIRAEKINLVTPDKMYEALKKHYKHTSPHLYDDIIKGEVLIDSLGTGCIHTYEYGNEYYYE